MTEVNVISARSAKLRSTFGGTKSLAVNGGALIVNVITGGLTGFVFWIVAARAVAPATVAQASAMVTTMLSIVTLSQTSLAVNVPLLIAGARRPRRLAAASYAAALALTGTGALLYALIAPQLASGVRFLRDPRLLAVFVFGCLIWSPFSLQDSVMTGLRWGKYVLLENSVWGVVRLTAVIVLPLLGIELGIGWLVASWLVPAAVLVAVVTYVLFIRSSSPLHKALGDHRFEKRALISFLGVEQMAALGLGLVAIAVPAFTLTELGATKAAPFLAAYSFIVVSESAMGSFASAFGVELRRNDGASRNLMKVTALLLGGFSCGMIALSQLFGDDFMALFGHEYRHTGGAVLRVLVLGLPARCVWMLSSSVNRLGGHGWRNLAQTGAYAVVLFAGLFMVGQQTAMTIALWLVIARFAAASVSARNLLRLPASTAGYSFQTPGPGA
jgi:hypothetical protein